MEWLHHTLQNCLKVFLRKMTSVDDFILMLTGQGCQNIPQVEHTETLKSNCARPANRYKFRLQSRKLTNTHLPEMAKLTLKAVLWSALRMWWEGSRENDDWGTKFSSIWASVWPEINVAEEYICRTVLVSCCSNINHIPHQEHNWGCAQKEM